MTSIFINSYEVASPPIGSRYPPVALTGSTSTITGASYGNGQYVVTASSEDISLNGQAYKAFDNSTYSSINNSWVTVKGEDNFGTNGNYNGSNFLVVDGINVYGAWIKIRLPSPVLINRYSLAGAADTASYHLAKRWYFIASNDGTNWTNLGTQKINISPASLNTKYFYDAYSTSTYLYYGLIITAISDPSLVYAYSILGEFGLFSPINNGLNLGSLIPSPTAAYSIRLLYSSYTGPVVNISDSSPTPVTINLYADQTGGLRLSPGGTGYTLQNWVQFRRLPLLVNTLFDQSGNGKNLTSTGSSRPQLDPVALTLVFNGSNYMSRVPGIFSGSVFRACFSCKASPGNSAQSIFAETSATRTNANSNDTACMQLSPGFILNYYGNGNDTPNFNTPNFYDTNIYYFMSYNAGWVSLTANNKFLDIQKTSGVNPYQTYADISNGMFTLGAININNSTTFEKYFTGTLTTFVVWDGTAFFFDDDYVTSNAFVNL
jgi:hypothetical protein